MLAASNSPHVPSPLARTDALSLSSSHPHARKQSILDGQFSLDVLSPTTSVPPFPYSPNSSSSTFSLTLDPIVEGAQSPYLSTPQLASPIIESFSPAPQINPRSNAVYAYPSPRHRPPPIGLGQPSARGDAEAARSASLPQSNFELVLYSYAQLTGTVSITPGTSSTPEQIQTLNGVRSALLKQNVIGGGSMNITSSLHQHHPPSPRTRHGRSSSASFLSILSPSSLLPSVTTPPNSAASASRWRSSSAAAQIPSIPSSNKFYNTNNHTRGLGMNLLGSSSTIEAISPDGPLPTFQVQPTMLAVDLALQPGESRSCASP